MVGNTDSKKGDALPAFWSEIQSIWKETHGSPGIKIAILDGPVDSSHSCFKGVRLVHVNTIASSGSRGDDSAHGTHVSSIILGRRRGPVPGVAPGCQGLIAPIFEAKDRSMSCRQIDLARAINQAVGLGAHVINISGGESGPPDRIDLYLEQAIRNCGRNNVLIVAAAGNDGCRCTHIPAAGPGVLVVGAMDSGNKPLKMSNWGAAYRDRGVLAPGRDIPAATPGGGVMHVTGTSFATALVSGVVGLLLSVQSARGNKPDPHFAAKAILESAHPCNPDATRDCGRFLAGGLNITGAYSIVSGASRGVASRAFRSIGARGFKAFGIDFTPPSRSGVPRSAGVCVSSPPAGDPFENENGSDPVGGGAVHNGRVGEKPVSRGKKQKVYAIGTLGYDYGSAAVRDTYREKMEEAGLYPDAPSDLLLHLDGHSHEPQEVASIIWTLAIDDTPAYVIRPAPAYSGVIYQRLVKYLEKQLADGAHMITIPGTIVGAKRLLSGHILPVVTPDPRGMSQWTIDSLVEDLMGAAPETKTGGVDYQPVGTSIRDFLGRVVYEFRNMGLEAENRVMNFAATRAREIKEVFESAVAEEMEFSDMRLEPLDFQRPGSRCREVALMFSDPGKPFTRAGRVYRFTVDVSEVIPVTLGEVNSWSVY